VAIGYLHVNTGNIQGAMYLFKCILDYRWSVPAAHVGLGSCQAMSAEYLLAIESFTHAIQQTTSTTAASGAGLAAYAGADIAEAWKRRGQCNNALGQSAAALADLNTASHLAPEDADNYYQLGIVMHSMKEYARALPYFQRAVRMGCAHAQCMNYLAMVHGQLGAARQSIQLHFAACKLDANLVEAKLNAGVCACVSVRGGMRVSRHTSPHPLPPPHPIQAKCTKSWASGGMLWLYITPS